MDVAIILASSRSDLQHAPDCFSANNDCAKMKINIKETKVVDLSKQLDHENLEFYGETLE